MTAYYNEIDPFAAQWLRNLVAKGLLADGEVDTRSIRDVRPDDLAGFDECHFFAGLGGWPLALQLAGWRGPVWTGSCPCQPFSAAGKQKGGADDRHLWPVWSALIRERRPATIFGEQVPGAIAHGWLDLVFDDLESAGYACGAVIAPAASVGAPHRRDRLWFTADANEPFASQKREQRSGQLMRAGGAQESCGDVGRAADVPDADGGGRQKQRLEDGAGISGSSGHQLDGLRSGRWGNGPDVAHADGGRQPGLVGQASQWQDGAARRPSQAVADAERVGSYGAGPRGAGRRQPADGGVDVADASGSGLPPPERHPFFGTGRRDEGRAASERGWWSTEPDVGRVAHGVRGRVGRLRAYGNAIVPQVAAEIVKAFMECRP